MACGSADTSGLKYLSDFKAKDFVKLGDYKGLEVQVKEPEITNDYLDGYLDYLLMNNPVSTPVTDRSVKVGDTANIDYEGKLDGVALQEARRRGTTWSSVPAVSLKGLRTAWLEWRSGRRRISA